MLGHLKPILCNLENEQKEIFWLNYCSVCAGLRQKHALPYSFVLNKEIVFVLIAFEKYIFEAEITTTQCPAKLFLAQKKIFKHQITEVSANLSIVLAYIKALDWYVDAPSFFKKVILARLKKKFDKIFSTLSNNLQNVIQDYIKITKENEKDFQKVQALSGFLAKNIALEISEYTSADLDFIKDIAQIFEELGKIIGIADHLIDFENDLITKQYNPIIENSHQNQNSYITEYKKMLSLYYLSKNHLERNFLNEIQGNFSPILKNAFLQLTNSIKSTTPKSIFEQYSQKDIVVMHNNCDGNCDCGGCEGCNGCDCNGCCNGDCSCCGNESDCNCGECGADCFDCCKCCDLFEKCVNNCSGSNKKNKRKY